MRNVFMHVGMPKAGSTSIQLSLRDYDDGRVRYARMGSPCHSGRVMFAFSTDPAATGFLRKRDLDGERIARVRDRCLGDLRREVALGRETLVISGEAIGSMPARDVAGMDAFFRDEGCRLHVFAYIREPVGFASSSFQQSVKAERDGFELKSCRPGYRRRFAGFLEVLEPARVTFRDFRRENLTGGSVVPDFAAAAGLDMGRVTEVRANESLSAGAVALLYFWNREREALPWGPENNIARSLMAKALAGHFSGRFKLSSAAVRAIVDDQDVAWMERAAGFGLRVDLDRVADDEEGAIGSELDLAAARDAALPALAALLDTLAIERPRKDTAFPMMRRLFRHFFRAARREVRQRKAARKGLELAG